MSRSSIAFLSGFFLLVMLSYSTAQAMNFYQCYQVTKNGKIYCTHVRSPSECGVKKNETTRINGEKVIYEKLGKHKNKCPGGAGFMRKMDIDEFKNWKQKMRIRE